MTLKRFLILRANHRLSTNWRSWLFGIRWGKDFAFLAYIFVLDFGPFEWVWSVAFVDDYDDIHRRPYWRR